MVEKSIVLHSIALFCNVYKVKVELLVIRQHRIKSRPDVETSYFEVT